NGHYGRSWSAAGLRPCARRGTSRMPRLTPGWPTGAPPRRLSPSLVTRTCSRFLLAPRQARQHPPQDVVLAYEIVEERHACVSDDQHDQQPGQRGVNGKNLIGELLVR